MARGWESKSVEEQISAKEAESRKSEAELTREQLENRAKREGLQLARAHTANALESARSERYREMLKRALAHLDSEIAKLIELESKNER